MIKRKVRVAHSRPAQTCNCLGCKLQCVGIRCGRWTWPQAGGVRSSLQSLPDLISLYVAKLLSVARSHQSLSRRWHLQIWGRSDLPFFAPSLTPSAPNCSAPPPRHLTPPEVIHSVFWPSGAPVLHSARLTQQHF